MGYHIIANFTENRDKPGSLKVYDDGGKLIFGPVQALGRGSNMASNKYNHSDWMRPNADVPTGTAMVKVYDRSSNKRSFGEHERVWVYRATGGNFLKAYQAGRSEIMIHGGQKEPLRSMAWYPLNPTYGCIRLSEEDQGALVKVLKAHGGEGKLTVNNL